MTQKTDPFVQLNWGWDDGENGWGSGMNENLILTAFLHNRRLDNILADGSMLPTSPVDGSAYFVNSDKNVYIRAEGQWYNISPPVGMTFIKKTDESVVKYDGTALVTDTKTISEVVGLQEELDAKVDDSQVGAVNGIAPLGADGKVPAINLPLSDSYLGAWNASTNTPTVVSSTGIQGQYYEVTVGGSTTIDGISSWVIGDKIKFNGTVWEKIPNTSAVSSVNGKIGAVVLTSTDVGAAEASHTHSNATTSVAGFMSSTDKSKLDGVSTGATANSSDSVLLARANHTGTQTASTISDLTEATQDTIASTLVAGTNITLSYNDTANTLTINSTASGSGGSTSFLGLTDSPSSYASQANKAVRVNVGETALEFVSLGTAAFNNTGDFANSSHTHSDATTSVAGFMSSTDKSKLDGIATGAEVNVNADWNATSGDAQILNKPVLAAIATSGSASDLTTGTMADARLPTTISTTKTFSGGDLVFNSATNTKNLYIGRSTSTTSETAKFGFDDSGLKVYQVNDEATSSISLTMYNQDTASGGGVSANTSYIYFDSSIDGSVVRANYFNPISSGSVHDVSGAAGSDSGIPSGFTMHNSNGWTYKSPTGVTTATFKVESSRGFQLSAAINGVLWSRGLHSSTDNSTWKQIWDSSTILDIGTTAASARTALSLASVASSGSASDLTTGTISDTLLPSTMSGKVFNSDVVFDSGTNTRYFYIARSNSAKLTQSCRFGVDDFGLQIYQTNDESSGSILITFNNTDTESGGGVGANTSYVTLSGSALGSTVSATFLQGDGSSVTSLDASNLTSGTIADARLSSNVALVANTISKATPSQTFQSLGTVSGSVSVTAASGMHVLATVSGNTTWTFPSPSSTEAHALTLELTNGGSYTMTWPTGTRWTGGIAPTLTASGTDILVFTKAGTNNWRGYLSSKDNR